MRSFLAKILSAALVAAVVIVLVESCQLMFGVEHRRARAAIHPKQVELLVDNPYSLGVDLLVECNWNHQKQHYDFREHIIVEKKSSKVIRVPGNLTSCKIWPKVDF